MSIITLMTDFGLSDNYVGVMKGVMASICPSATVIDLTHGIAAQDVVGAAYSLYTAYRYFPEDTIHVVVVDPGVGSGRRVIAVRSENGMFVAPDNGVLSPVIEKEPVKWIVSVENKAYFLSPVSRTFHGRDVFAPVAAHLAKGTDPDRLGFRISRETLVSLEIPSPEIGEDGGLSGQIIAVDRFGNLVTNIDAKIITRVFGKTTGRNFGVRIKNERIEGVSEIYGSVEVHEPLALIGSGGMLELSVNQGDASEFFRAGRGDTVSIYRSIST